jgi:hypothetical protein
MREMKRTGRREGRWFVCAEVLVVVVRVKEKRKEWRRREKWWEGKREAKEGAEQRSTSPKVCIRSPLLLFFCFQYTSTPFKVASSSLEAGQKVEGKVPTVFLVFPRFEAALTEARLAVASY